MKKLWGVLFIITGSTLAILTVFTLTQLGKTIPDTAIKNKVFFLAGYIGGCLLIGIPAFFLLKYGVKKLKEKDIIY